MLAPLLFAALLNAPIIAIASNVPSSAPSLEAARRPEDLSSLDSLTVSAFLARLEPAYDLVFCLPHRGARARQAGEYFAESAYLRLAFENKSGRYRFHFKLYFFRPVRNALAQLRERIEPSDLPMTDPCGKYCGAARAVFGGCYIRKFEFRALDLSRESGDLETARFVVDAKKAAPCLSALEGLARASDLLCLRGRLVPEVLDELDELYVLRDYALLDQNGTEDFLTDFGRFQYFGVLRLEYENPRNGGRYTFWLRLKAAVALPRGTYVKYYIYEWRWPRQNNPDALPTRELLNACFSSSEVAWFTCGFAARDEGESRSVLVKEPPRKKGNR